MARSWLVLVGGITVTLATGCGPRNTVSNQIPPGTFKPVPVAQCIAHVQAKAIHLVDEIRQDRARNGRDLISVASRLGTPMVEAYALSGVLDDIGEAQPVPSNTAVTEDVDRQCIAAARRVYGRP